MKKRFVVIDGDKLGVITPLSPDYMTVLGCHVPAMRNPLDGPLRIKETKNIRPATRQDFEDYRVLFSQWPEDEYELPSN